MTAWYSFQTGLLAFFSARQACLMQVAPFFAFFILASYLTLRFREKGSGIGQTALASLGLVYGFSLSFGAMNALSINSSHGPYGAVAGAVIIAAGAMLALFASAPRVTFKAAAIAAASPAVGAALAAGYSPCVPVIQLSVPAYAAMPAEPSAVLLTAHGAGIALAMAAFSLAPVFVINAFKKRPALPRPGPAMAAAAAFAVMGFLLLTGFMDAYSQMVQVALMQVVSG